MQDDVTLEAKVDGIKTFMEGQLKRSSEEIKQGQKSIEEKVQGIEEKIEKKVQGMEEK